MKYRVIDEIVIETEDTERTEVMIRRAATRLRKRNEGPRAPLIYDGGGDFLPRIPTRGRYIYSLYFGHPGQTIQRYSVELRQAVAED